jgi:hypothetical protein
MPPVSLPSSASRGMRRVAQLVEDVVASVSLVSLDQKLRGEQTMSVLGHGDVDVRRMRHSLQRIWDRLDGAAGILARGAGEEAAVTLKVRVVTVGLAPVRMNVRRAATHLPDFHERR